MISAVLIVQCTPQGVMIDQVPMIQSDDPVERAIASLLDLALATAGRYIAEQARNCLAIEGKNIEPLVTKALEGSEWANLRKIMKDAGYEV